MDEDIATSAADPFDWAREQGLNTIRIGIYQPKVFANGLEDWVCTMEDLRQFATLARSKAARRAQCRGDARQDPDGRVGSHLPEPEPERRERAFCRAMPTCPSAQRKVVEVVGADFDVITDETTVPKTS